MKKRSSWFVQKVVSLGMTGALLVSMSTGTVSAGLQININGNGTDSNNSAQFTISQQTSISQTNALDITNDVESNANTGGNTVSNNVGDVTIQTGDITSSTSIVNEGGTNKATAGCDSCHLGDVSATIAKNGTGSKTTLDLTAEQNTQVVQQNNAQVKNIVDADLNTGFNESKKNVGDSKIRTGDITANVTYHNKVGKNIYKNPATSNSWNVGVDIFGNGAYSHVQVGLAFDTTRLIDQINNVDLLNITKIDANTGGNECLKNVGDCDIITGKIAIGTAIGNVGGINHVSDGKGDKDIPTPPDDGNGGTLPDEEKPSKDDDKSVVDKIKDIIFPPAEAATDDQVLGAIELPTTGLGELPYVSWAEALTGLFLVALGGYMRHWVSRLQKRHVAV